MPQPSRDGGYGSPGGAGADSRLSLLRELGEQAVLETIFRQGPITRPEIAAATEPLQAHRLGRGQPPRTERPDPRRGPAHRPARTQPGRIHGQQAGGVRGRRRHRRKQSPGRGRRPVRRADLRSEAADDQGRQPSPRDAGPGDGHRGDRPGRRRSTAGRWRSRSRRPGSSTRAPAGSPRSPTTSCPEGGFDPLEVIRDRLELPVLVENNVNLAAVGEKWFGLARGVSTMVFIAVGAGIGMGIVIDDQVVRGAHGAAGEIGYLPLAGDPFDPRHRLHGGLEDEIGAAGIVAAFNERRGPNDPELSAAHEVFELAARWKRGGAIGGRSRRRPAGHGDRDGVRDSRSGAGRARRRHRLESSAALRPVRGVGGRAGSDHRAHRDQPARRPSCPTGSDRHRAERRAHLAALRGRRSRPPKRAVAAAQRS